MEQILFAEACRLWKEEKSRDVKVTTLAAYSLIIDRNLLPRFRTLEEITPESIQEMVDDEASDDIHLFSEDSVTPDEKEPEPSNRKKSDKENEMVEKYMKLVNGHIDSYL